MDGNSQTALLPSAAFPAQPPPRQSRTRITSPAPAQIAGQRGKAMTRRWDSPRRRCLIKHVAGIASIS